MNNWFNVGSQCLKIKLPNAIAFNFKASSNFYVLKQWRDSPFKNNGLPSSHWMGTVPPWAVFPFQYCWECRNRVASRDTIQFQYARAKIGFGWISRMIYVRCWGSTFSFLYDRCDELCSSHSFRKWRRIKRLLLRKKVTMSGFLLLRQFGKAPRSRTPGVQTAA